MPPDEFIPVAERTGLISPLSAHLLRCALSAMASWPEDIWLSFDLSACDIASPDAVDRLMRIVSESGIPPSRLEFEITETAVMRDFDHACDVLGRLRAMGIRAALDDFGTGCSSLSYVHLLPLDKIKIDRNFITSIESNETSRNIVKSIVGLCRNIDVDCIIEGLETSGQLAAISALGVWLVQGYLFAKPMSGDAVDDYIGKFPKAERTAGA